MPIEYSNVATGALEGLTAALSQREAERRQAMLDQIQIDREDRLRQQHEASMRLQQSQLASVDDARKATADLKAQQEFDKKIANRRAGDVVGSDLYEEAKRIGRTDDFEQKPGEWQQGELQETDEQGVPHFATKQLPGVISFKGTAAERQKMQQREAVKGIIVSNPSLAENEEVKLALQVAEATGDYGGLYSALAQMTKPQKPNTENVGGYLFEQQADGTWKKVAEGRAPTTNIHMPGGMTPTAEGNFVLSMQRSWDKTRSAEKEMNRQMIIMQQALQRFPTDPVGGSEGIRVTFEKILDPISVVREGEYARQGQGLSLLHKLEGLSQKWFTGGGPVPEPALREMVGTAEAFMAGLQGFNLKEQKRMELTADRYKIPRDMVFGPALDDAPPPPPGPGAPPPRGGGPGPGPAAPAPRVRRFNPATGKLE